MILEADEIEARVSSPLNLLNRLRAESNRAASIVSIPSGLNKVEPVKIPSIPDVDSLVEGVEDKINKGIAVSGAKAVMAKSIKELERRLIEVDNPMQLSRIATDMNKIVNADSDQRGNHNNNAPIVIWKPEVHNESHYETIIVSD